MYGAVGVRLLDDSERPGQFVPDPGSLFADGGKNWGSFFVAGSVGGVTQFIARVQDNATFAASMASPFTTAPRSSTIGAVNVMVCASSSSTMSR